MAVPKQELTTLDLCKMFDVSRTTIYQWRRKGLPYYRLAGNGLHDPVRYNVDAVVEFAREIDRDPINIIY